MNNSQTIPEHEETASESKKWDELRAIYEREEKMWIYVVTYPGKNEHDGQQCHSLASPEKVGPEIFCRGGLQGTILLEKEVSTIAGEIPVVELENLKKFIESLAADPSVLERTKDYTRVIRDKTFKTPPPYDGSKFVFFKVDGKVHRSYYRDYFEIRRIANQLAEFQTVEMELLSDEELDKIQTIEERFSQDVCIGSVFISLGSVMQNCH